MILICTADEALARRISHGAHGRRIYAATVDAALRLAAERPSAILLDVRLGGSGRRAVEIVPDLRAASPLSAIVVLTRRPTVDELEEIADLGVYTWADIEDPTIARYIRLILDGARSRAAAGSTDLPGRRRRAIH